MRRILWLGLIATLALAAAGMAVAHRGADAEKASATFAASATDNVKTHTCGTTQWVTGLFTGEASSSDTRLDGPISIRVHSVYDGEDEIGVVQGKVRFSHDDEEGKGGARLYAVNDKGKLHGLLVGGVREPGAHLVATFTADFDAAGFKNGNVGTGGAGDNAGAVWKKKACGDEEGSAATSKRGGERERNHAVRGEVTEITSTSITVKTEDGQVSCTLTAEQSARLSDRVKAGDKVDLSCNAEGKLLKIRLKE